MGGLSLDTSVSSVVFNLKFYSTVKADLGVMTINV